MVFLLNIGNTHTQIAEAVNGKINLTRKVMTADLNGDMLPSGMPIAASTVVPEVRERLRGLDIFWLEPGCKCDIDFSLVDLSTLGADRMANLIAMDESCPLPALCIDFGTAITFELLDEKKVFIGGAIAPGRLMMRNGMHDYTAQLPLVSFKSLPPEEPGTTTVEQMLLGINAGAVGAVKELIEIMRRWIGGDLKIIAVGGDYEFFTENIAGIEYAGDDFTLKGILKAWEINGKCK